jgi:hypothetical protein
MDHVDLLEHDTAVKTRLLARGTDRCIYVGCFCDEWVKILATDETSKG